MKRIVTVTLFMASLVLVELFPADSQALGHSRRGGDCCAPCEVPCAVAPAAPPKMIERVVTKYRPEWKEQEVLLNVCKMISREEKYNYFVYVPVTKQENRKVTTY